MKYLIMVMQYNNIVPFAVKEDEKITVVFMLCPRLVFIQIWCQLQIPMAVVIKH